jgi:hypothetical protein
MPEYLGGINQMAFGLMVCMGILLLVLPRRYAFVPLFAAACYMTMGQVIKVGELNFSIIRILTLVGWLRLSLRREFRVFPLNTVDRAMLYWTVATVTIYTILWGTTDAFIYKCGYVYDAIGLYVLFRSLIRSIDEITTAFRMFVLLIVPLAVLMLIEKATGRNLFAIFGGVPAFTLVRDGVLRCQGPFPHSILAGTFAAALLPQFVALWWQRGSGRLLSIVGVGCAAVITAASGSSGPVMTFACGMIGLAFWPCRLKMRAVRWGLVLLLVGLQIVMKAPFWFVIAHMAVRSGSDAFYRAFLIDRTIAHFGEWWLIGTKYQVPWATKLTDITNMYVRVAMDGGLVTLVLFLTLLRRSFCGVGRALRAKRHAFTSQQHCIWALGASLFAHVMTFLAVWYWDQNIVNWYLLLAMIGTLSAPAYLVHKKERPASSQGQLAPAFSVDQSSSFSDSIQGTQQNAQRLLLLD